MSFTYSFYIWQYIINVLMVNILLKYILSSVLHHLYCGHMYFSQVWQRKGGFDTEIYTLLMIKAKRINEIWC